MLDQYSPQLIESNWYQYWEENGLFHSELNSSKHQENYCIMLPPPNVTGSLHMGHAFQHTIMDCLIRHQRMLGKKVLWQPGTDHAGIATQIVVEKQIQAKGLKKEDLGRKEFIKQVWQWKKQSGGKITSQMRRLGLSVDWSKEKFTLDDEMIEAVIKVFVDLYYQGLIYRGEKLVNWDPTLKTAISDLEVEARLEMGVMYYVNYPLIDKKTNEPSKHEFITIATTRPETILADGAIALNPEDTRCSQFSNREVRVPMTTRNIPIIFDDYVDSTFGTGCVKITPAHDYNDYKVGVRHKTEVINLFNDDASMNKNAPKKYQGMDRFVAREQIVKDLDQAGLLLKKEKHSYKRPYSERTGVVVEPYLSQQWYIDTKILAEKAIEVVQSGELKLIPENWKKTYFHWLNNIEDWCISRQLWWGHQIPAYYDKDGNIFVAHSFKEANEKAKEFHGFEVKLKQDEDVLDTWFSSALWPFSTLGWPNESKKMQDFYPTSVLVTGFDIIFFWVARMVMFGCRFTGKIPFKEVYLTGLIRDYDGQKMSKSKGNVIDPLDIIDGISLDDLVQKRVSHLMKPKISQMIEKKTKETYPQGIEAHGADALRFSFLSQASFGRDVRFYVSKIAGYRNFCNKVFNAAKYTLNIASLQKENLFESTSEKLHPFDSWIISKLQDTTSLLAKHLEEYRLDMAAEVIYQFIWHQFCDWYLEMSKTILYHKGSTEEQKRNTTRTTVLVFESSLRLLHPMMPFITEELWQNLKKSLIAENKSNLESLFKEKSISLCSYPIAKKEKKNSNIENEIEFFQNMVLAIRQIRSDRKITYKTPLIVHFENETIEQKNILNKFSDTLKNMLNLSEVHWANKDENSLYASAVINGLKLLVNLEGTIDLESEKENLHRKILTNKKEIHHLEQKLANENFCTRAPQKLVDEHKNRLETAKINLNRLEEQFGSLEK